MGLIRRWTHTLRLDNEFFPLKRSLMHFIRLLRRENKRANWSLIFEPVKGHPKIHFPAFFSRIYLKVGIEIYNIQSYADFATKLLGNIWLQKSLWDSRCATIFPLLLRTCKTVASQWQEQHPLLIISLVEHFKTSATPLNKYF